MAVGIGPPATRNCEPRQARKGAAAAVASCAGVWLILTATLLIQVNLQWTNKQVASFKKHC